MIYYQKKRALIPCEVVYSHERFYLKCFSEETQARRVYRIDRMKGIEVGEKSTLRPKLPKPKGAVIDIYEPEHYAVIRLRVKCALLDDMLEQLGRYAAVRPDSTDSDTVIIRASIGISFDFYHWVLKYGSDVEILSPEDVRQTFIEKLTRIIQQYQNPPKEL